MNSLSAWALQSINKYIAFTSSRPEPEKVVPRNGNWVGELIEAIYFSLKTNTEAAGVH